MIGCDTMKLKEMVCYNNIKIKNTQVYIKLGPCGPDPERLEIADETHNAIWLMYYFLINNTQNQKGWWLPKMITTIRNGILSMPKDLAKREGII